MDYYYYVGWSFIISVIVYGLELYWTTGLSSMVLYSLVWSEMKVTIQLEMEDEEDVEDGHRVLDVVRDSLDGNRSSVGSQDNPEQSEAGEANENRLSDREAAIYQAVQDRRGRSRRLIHERAAELDGDLFTDPENDGSERSQVGSTLWTLEDRGLIHHDGNRWYPGGKA